VWSLLAEKLNEALKAVVPLILVVALMQFALVGADAPSIFRFLGGGALVVAGVLLLFAGLDLGILPMGRFIGAALPDRGSIALILAVAFALGFATTIAEPDVLVLARQVDEVSQGAVPGSAVLYVTALGVAALVALGMARIVSGFPMPALLAGAYALVIALSFLAPAAFVPLAYDAGSVTTGVLTAPVVIALAIGLSSVLAGRSAVTDGFGLLGLASIGPIIAIMIMAMVQR
jgi:Protein of unknown function (DUF1538)